MTHNNNNDIILRSWSILFDEVVGHAAQQVRIWCHLTIFKCQPRPAWFPTVLEWPLCSIFCFILSLFHLRICFSLRLFLFCQGRRHFLQDTSYRARYFFFWSENFCRTFGPADWRFLSDIMNKCPIVRQVRRISTALHHTESEYNKVLVLILLPI